MGLIMSSGWVPISTLPVSYPCFGNWRKLKAN